MSWSAVSPYASIFAQTHDLYRSHSSSKDWVLQDNIGAFDGLQHVKIYRLLHKKGVSYKVIACVPDGKDAVVLRPRNFGAVLAGTASNCLTGSIFESVTVLKRIDARTTLRHLKARKIPNPRDYIVAAQTVATSTTFVYLSTSIPDEYDIDASTIEPTYPFTRGRISLLSWAVERAAEWNGLKITCFLQTDPSDDSEIDDGAVLAKKIPSSISLAAKRLRKDGFIPYLLDYASSVQINIEEYDNSSEKYHLKWDVLDIVDEGTDSLQADEKVPMLELRLDYRRWLKTRGLNITFKHESAESTSNSLEECINVSADLEGGWNVACHRSDSVDFATYTMTITKGGSGVTVNGMPAITDFSTQDAPRDSGDIRYSVPGTVSDAGSVSLPAPNSSGSISSHSEDGIGASSSESAITDSVPPGAGATSCWPHPPHFEHRFDALVHRVSTLFAELLEDDSFDHVTTSKNISVYKRDAPGHPVGILKGVGTYDLESGLGLWDVLSVIQAPGARKVWDGNLDYEKILEQPSPSSLVTYVMNKGVWPTSPRDAVAINTIIVGEDHLRLIGTSIEDDPVAPPVNKAHVRAYVDLAAWDLQVVRSGLPSGKNSIRITHIIQFDPRGWIPGGLLKAVSTQLPMSVAAVMEYLTLHGPPPSVVGGLEECRLLVADYDHATARFAVEVERTNGQEPLLVRVELVSWCQGNFAVEASCEGTPVTATLRRDARFGVNSVLVAVHVPTGGRTSVSVVKGPPDTGVQLNGQVASLPADVPVHSRRNSSREAGTVATGSVPVSVPTMLHSASVEPEGDWGSPAGRLSVSAVMPGATWKWPFEAADDSEEVSTATPTSNVQSGQTESAVLEQASDSERLKKVRNAGESAFGKLLRLHKDTVGWKTLRNGGSGLSTYEKNTPSSTSSASPSVDLPVMKGTKVIEGFAADDIYAVLSTHGCRKVWDDALEDGENVEFCDRGVSLSYLTLKGFFPVSRRDVLAVCKDALLPSVGTNPSQTIVRASASVSDTLLSPTGFTRVSHGAGSKVRASLKIAGWILEPIDPYEATQRHPIPSTRVTVFYQLDLGGAVPQAMYGWMVGNAPKHPLTIEAYLKEHGVPPRITKPSLFHNSVRDEDCDSSSECSRNFKTRISSSSYDHTKAEYVVEFNVMPNATRSNSFATAKQGLTERAKQELFDMEMDESHTRDVSSEEEEDELLLEFMVDLKRYPLGYHIKWSTAGNPTTNVVPINGLKFQVVEIPPPSTHFTAAGVTTKPVKNGVASVDAKRLDDALMIPLAVPNKTKKLVKHAVQVYWSASAVPSVDTDVIPSFSVKVNLDPALPKNVGVTGLWSAALGGEDAFEITINDRRAPVLKEVDFQKHRLKTKSSRSSLAGARPSVTAASDTKPGPAADLLRSTISPTKAFLNGLLSRRRPRAATDGGSEALEKAGLTSRVSSMPVSSLYGTARQSSHGRTISPTIPYGSGKRRASITSAFPMVADRESAAQTAHNPRSSIRLTKEEVIQAREKLETPPRMESSEKDVDTSASGTKSKRRDKAQVVGSTPGSPTRKSYSLWLCLLVGIVCYMCGWLLRVHYLDGLSKSWRNGVTKTDPTGVFSGSVVPTPASIPGTGSSCAPCVQTPVQVETVFVTVTVTQTVAPTPGTKGTVVTS